MISIVIPTLNEVKALPHTLECVFEQAGDYEVIVVDASSDDGTLDCLEEFSNLKVVTTKQGRANQMNTGAELAQGEWLLFLHADALLPRNALIEITKQKALAGGFRHKFSGKGWGLQFVSWLHNFRCSCTGVFYGDQALFIRKSLFIKMGGFPDVANLEDLIFGEKLVAMTNPVFLNKQVISDSRKFEQQGIWLSLWRVLQIQFCYEFKLPFINQKFFARIR